VTGMPAVQLQCIVQQCGMCVVLPAPHLWQAGEGRPPNVQVAQALEVGAIWQGRGAAKRAHAHIQLQCRKQWEQQLGFGSMALQVAIGATQLAYVDIQLRVRLSSTWLCRPPQHACRQTRNAKRNRQLQSQSLP